MSICTYVPSCHQYKHICKQRSKRKRKPKSTKISSKGSLFSPEKFQRVQLGKTGIKSILFFNVLPNIKMYTSKFQVGLQLSSSPRLHRRGAAQVVTPREAAQWQIGYCTTIGNIVQAQLLMTLSTGLDCSNSHMALRMHTGTQANGCA